MAFSSPFCQHHKRSKKRAQALTTPRKEVSGWKSKSSRGAGTERSNEGHVSEKGRVKPSGIRMGQSFLEKLTFTDLWR